MMKIDCETPRYALYYDARTGLAFARRVGFRSIEHPPQFRHVASGDERRLDALALVLLGEYFTR